MSSQPSYVIGSSFSLNDLTEEEIALLDRAKWVFVCNSFLSHWQAAGFRPTVWCWGDNHLLALLKELKVELSTLSTDGMLQQRLQHIFIAKEDFAREAEQATREFGMLAQFYRRGACWAHKPQPASSLTDTIYHHGSTLTNLVNFARILNPDGAIKLYGNEWGEGYGHFWEGRVTHRYPKIWPRVKVAMWEGLASLHRDFDYPLIDCNRHPEPLPEEYRLPVGELCA